MEAAIITLLAILIVISLGGFWRIRTDMADFKADIARMDAKLDTHTERLAGHDTQLAILSDRNHNSLNDTKSASTAKSENLAEASA